MPIKTRRRNRSGSKKRGGGTCIKGITCGGGKKRTMRKKMRGGWGCIKGFNC